MALRARDTDGRPGRRVALTLARTGAAVASVEVADTPAARRRGLLGRTGLEPGTGMLISPCRSIHTWFMRFAIDAVFLDRSMTVVKIVPELRPRRLAWGGWRARDTLELPAGAATKAGLQPGDVLVRSRPPS